MVGCLFFLSYPSFSFLLLLRKKWRNGNEEGGGLVKSSSNWQLYGGERRERKRARETDTFHQAWRPKGQDSRGLSSETAACSPEARDATLPRYLVGSDPQPPLGDLPRCPKQEAQVVQDILALWGVPLVGQDRALISGCSQLLGPSSPGHASIRCSCGFTWLMTINRSINSPGKSISQQFVIFTSNFDTQQTHHIQACLGSLLQHASSMGMR